MRKVTLNSLDQPYPNRWTFSHIKSHVHGPIKALMQVMAEAGISDNGMRVHGASALNVWGRGISKRFWVMAGHPTSYDNIRITLDLQEVDCYKYGRYLKYRPKPGAHQVHIMYPSPDVMTVMSADVVSDDGWDMPVASMNELRAYYAMRVDNQLGLYKLTRK